MNKSALNNFVIKNTTLTFQDLKNMVENINDLNGQSKCNKNLSREFVINDIFIPYLKDLHAKNVDFSTVIQTTHYCTRTNKIKLNSYGTIMKNILTEVQFNG